MEDFKLVFSKLLLKETKFKVKRVGYLFEKVVNLPNLHLAEIRARKNKSKRKEVVKFNENRTDNILKLYFELKNQTYQTSEYYQFTIFEPKKRNISKLSYRDNIVHHAILNILEPILLKSFISQTYSCIKTRGILKCSKTLRNYLKDEKNTKYCLKLDISKFYESVDNNILKQHLENKIKDRKLLNLVYKTVDKTKGIVLGNYTSQWLGNLYLNKFDHWIKQRKNIKYYSRYCDDMCILSSNKEELHRLRREIEVYLQDNLKLKLSNYQVFPVESRGIDYVGYKHFHGYTLLRNMIKKRFKKMLKKNPNRESIASYNGWLVHCNSANLRRKYLNYGNK